MPGASPQRGTDGPSDTTAEAAAVQLRRLREVGPGERSGLANEISETVVEATRRALRRRMPGASDREVGLAFIAVAYGHELAAKVEAFLRKS